MAEKTTPIVCPPAVVPFMEKHGDRATKALTDFLEPIPTLDEKLGALGAFAQVLLAVGDGLRAMQDEKAKH